jgi:sec-independent protein translocase protein TatA
MFNGVGGSEIILVLLVILLLFGSKRIPGFSRALGRGMGEFRRAMKEIREEIESEPLDENPGPRPKPLPEPQPQEPEDNPYAGNPYSETTEEEDQPPAG